MRNIFFSFQCTSYELIIPILLALFPFLAYSLFFSSSSLPAFPSQSRNNNFYIPAAHLSTPAISYPNYRSRSIYYYYNYTYYRYNCYPCYNMTMLLFLPSTIVNKKRKINYYYYLISVILQISKVCLSVFISVIVEKRCISRPVIITLLF